MTHVLTLAWCPRPNERDLGLPSRTQTVRARAASEGCRGAHTQGVRREVAPFPGEGVEASYARLRTRFLTRARPKDPVR